MVTKGIIKKLCDINDNHFTVYVPLFKKANAPVETAYLQATLISIPGIDDSLNVDDVVYVAFEDGKFNRLVILGKLYSERLDKKDVSTAMTAKTLTVTEKAKLPQNVSIDGIDVVDLKKKINWLMENTTLPQKTTGGGSIIGGIGGSVTDRTLTIFTTSDPGSSGGGGSMIPGINYDEI